MPIYHGNGSQLLEDGKPMPNQPNNEKDSLLIIHNHPLWIKTLVDELVRDVTKVGSIPKSEVRRRIMGLIQSIKKEYSDICPKCRGKGYSTEFKGYTVAPDMPGDVF